jgi:DNA-binding NtrC family response regulator
VAHALPSLTAVDAMIRFVLLVDDDDDCRALMAEALAEAGFGVSTAENGRAALALWARAPVDVVVTDVQMPLMNGCELFAALRSIDRTLPVIVVTGDDLATTTSTFPGAFRFIRKPARADAVISAVTEALLQRRAPSRRRISTVARAITNFGRAKGHAALSSATTFLRPPDNAAGSVVRKRRRAGLAAAGFGAAAAVAFLIAAIRGLVV